MGVEEQLEEREVLQSIFPDEITDISDNSYRVSISLDLPKGLSDSEVSPTIWLTVSYPEAYPDVPPNLDLSAPPNGQKHDLLDIQADKAQLLDSLQSTIDDSIGMAMVFTLVTTLKDTAEVLMADRERQAAEVVEVAAREKEQEENRKFEGEKVTKERFVAWRTAFKKEMEQRAQQKREDEEAELKLKKVRAEEKKLTGRQLWERGLIGKSDEEDDIDALGEQLEQTKV